MPIITLNNNLFRIKELRVDQDSTGYYLTMNSGKSAACVICVSSQHPITMDELSLSESDLSSLANGGNLSFPEKGYSLQGITRPQLAAAPQFRKFHLIPPCYVQVWGMAKNSLDGVVLHLPGDSQEQQVLVPVDYKVEWNDNSLTISIQTSEGYQDGDLMYQVADHRPIPIPGAYLNRAINLRPGICPMVFPASSVEEKYRAL